MMTKIIHIGKYFDGQWQLIKLHETTGGYSWDCTPPIGAVTIEQAIHLAIKGYKHLSFQLLGCGYLFQITPRDEIGVPARFDQMCRSLSSPTGTYFDEDLGYQCIVRNPSDEAVSYWRGQ